MHLLLELTGAAMRDFEFEHSSTTRIPPRRRTYLVAVPIYTGLFLALVLLNHPHALRVGDGGPQTGIAAYVPGPIGTAGTTTKPAEPKKPAPTTAKMAKPAPSPSEADDAGQAGGAAGTPGGAGGSGPVRLGSGGDLTLLKRVQPIYPPRLETMRIAGTVVLDAVIHRDGSIGDITILRSTNGEFAQSAVAAVKQWRYTPIPYEGIVTVTVNFTTPA